MVFARGATYANVALQVLLRVSGNFVPLATVAAEMGSKRVRRRVSPNMILLV